MRRERGELCGHIEKDHRSGKRRTDPKPPRHVPQLEVLVRRT